MNSNRPRHLSRLLCTAITAALGLPLYASAITVTQGGDAHVSGRCTLREAIQSGNAWTAPADTDCANGTPGGTSIDVPFERIELTQGPLAPAGTVGIQGTSPSRRTLITRAANAAEFSIFHTAAQFPDNPVTLRHLQISGGVAGSDGGGGILAEGILDLYDSVVSGNTAIGDGGGIKGDGYKMLLVDSTISGNTTAGSGGGISSSKYIGLQGSTVSYNSAQGPGGGVALNGYAEVGSSNTTIAGNATHANGGHGGGIFLGLASVADLRNSTVSRNTVNANSSGAGVYVDPTDTPNHIARITSSSSIIDRNVAGKYEENLAAGAALTVAGDRNLIGPVSAEISVPVDTLSCDPGLGVLQNNGGVTETMRLAAGSCAIDQGIDNGLPTDQRGGGHPRSIGVHADIGAIEFDPDEIFFSGFD